MFLLVFVVFVDSFSLTLCFHVVIFVFFIWRVLIYLMLLWILYHVINIWIHSCFHVSVLSSAGLRTEPARSLEALLGGATDVCENEVWAALTSSWPQWCHQCFLAVGESHSEEWRFKTGGEIYRCYHDDEVGLHAVTWSSSLSRLLKKNLIVCNVKLTWSLFKGPVCSKWNERCWRHFK